MKNQTLNILNHMPLREGMVIHNIKYIALSDDKYYLKTSGGAYYSMDKQVLREMCLLDISGMCTKAYRTLNNNQMVDKEGITDIDGVNLVKNEFGEDELLMAAMFIAQSCICNKSEEVGDKILNTIDKSELDEMTYQELLEYIPKCERKYHWIYEMLLCKWEEEYNTIEKKISFFEGSNLNGLSAFMDFYGHRDSEVSEILENIWRRKSREKLSLVMSIVDKMMYKSTDKYGKYWSNIYMKQLCDDEKISTEEYEIVRKMNNIMHIMMSANVKHINYTTFENLSTVYEFMDIVESNTKSVEVSKIIRLTEDEILDLIEEFYGLSELLDVEE